MPGRFSLVIAGLGISFTLDDLALADKARRLYKQYAEEVESSIKITICVSDELANQKPRPIKTTYNDGVFHVDSDSFTGNLDTSAGSATFYIEPEWQTFDAVIRVIISILLVTYDGLLLHASSVSRGGNAFVFPARSEGGKSTVARLLQDDEVIGDELVALRRIRNIVTVYGTPFWNAGPAGSLPPAQAPVKAICLLTKADRTSATKLEPVEMAAKMLRHIFCDPENREANRATLNALAGITETVSCYDLRFRLDAEDLRRCLDEIN